MEQKEIESRIMGIDYGEKRIGVALTDPLITFAYPFETFQNDSKFLQRLKKIIEEKKVCRIILGLPSSKYRSSKVLSERVLKLKSEIEDKLKIEVILWDEEYTSLIAREKVIESVTKKSIRKKKDILDKHSAAVILQEYLDSK